jgi:hypothetical protein
MPGSRPRRWRVLATSIIPKRLEAKAAGRTLVADRHALGE